VRHLRIGEIKPVQDVDRLAAHAWVVWRNARDLVCVCAVAGSARPLSGCVTDNVDIAHEPSPPDATGAHWSLKQLDVDVYPDFAGRHIRVHGREVLQLDGKPSLGPTLRLGHDLTPFVRNPAEHQFMRYTQIDAGSDAAIQMNRPGEAPGVVLADVRFRQARQTGDTITLSFDAEDIEQSFEFVITSTVAFGADKTGWYPRPTLAAGEPWSSTLESAAGVTRLHLPDGWSSLATGDFVGREREQNGVVETWRKDRELRRARAFVAGPYRVQKQSIGRNEAWVFSLTAASDPTRLLPNVAAIIGALSARFGAYPFSKYAAAEFPDDAVQWWGDAEGDFQVLRKSLLDASNGGVVPLSHEIGHAWWGNTVAPAWPGGYMVTEAMAGYCSLLVLETMYGRERYEKALYTQEPGSPPDYTIPNYFKAVGEHKDVALSKLTEDSKSYELSLVKGTFFYHMLRQRVGDGVFFDVLRSLVATHFHKTLSLDELRSAFMAAAPNAGLSAFFEQWLDRTGAPIFNTTLSCAKDGATYVTTLVLEQKQDGAPYTFSLDVRFDGDGGAVGATVRVDGSKTRYQQTGPACYSSVVLDPGHALFIWRPEYAVAAGH
jgi:hypothetical protein